MKKTWLRIVTGLCAVFLVAQLFRPDLTNPPSDPSLSITSYKGVPPEVLSTIQSVCFDCHSNQTQWPWYSRVTPINYYIASDVNSGRRHVNFSEWNEYSPGRLKSVLDNIYDQVYNHEMPLPQYRWMHPKARLTAAHVKMICDWAGGEEDRLDQVSEMQSHSSTKGQTPHDTTGTKK